MEVEESRYLWNIYVCVGRVQQIKDHLKFWEIYGILGEEVDELL
jgi:hypothetical protein